MGYQESFDRRVRELVISEGYLAGDQLGNVPPQNISGIGVVDPAQSVMRRSGFLWLRKTPVYAHIASFLEDSDGSISATVFGRANLNKVRSLADKVGQLFESQVTLGLATEDTKYGPDRCRIL